MLVTSVGALTLALPIEHVVEILRPLHVEPLGHARETALAIVDGIAVIRGEPVPVIDARRLLGVAAVRATRWVVVRAGTRRIALAVESVNGVHAVAPEKLSALSPIVAHARGDAISAIGAHDAGLAVVLDAGRVITNAGWRALERRG